MTNGPGKSDRPTVPGTGPNKTRSGHRAGKTRSARWSGYVKQQVSHPRAGQVAAGGCGRTLSLLRSAHEPTGAGDVSIPSRLVLASHAFAAEPERPRPLGSHAASHDSLAAPAYCLSSLSPAPHGRHHLRHVFVNLTWPTLIISFGPPLSSCLVIR